jgi:hypothetical protein
MTRNDLTSSEKVLFDYQKKFEIEHNKASEELAERLAMKKIQRVRETSKKVRHTEFGH